MEWILVFWFTMSGVAPSTVVIEKFTTLTACEIAWADFKSQTKDMPEGRTRHVCIPRK